MTEKKSRTVKTEKKVKQKQKQTQKQVVNVNIGNVKTKTTRRKKKTTDNQQPKGYLSPEQKMRISQTFTPPVVNPMMPSNFEVLDTIKMMMGQQKTHPVIDDIAPRLNHTLQDGLRQIKDEIQNSNKASLSINTGLPMPVKPIHPDKTDIVPKMSKPSLTFDGDVYKKVVSEATKIGGKRFKQKETPITPAYLNEMKDFGEALIEERNITDDAISVINSRTKGSLTKKKYDEILDIVPRTKQPRKATADVAPSTDIDLRIHNQGRTPKNMSNGKKKAISEVNKRLDKLTKSYY